MFYGEGAGNRRKMIKAKVDQRSKDAAYKKAFDNHVSNTNREKRGQDVKNSAGKTAREIRNLPTSLGKQPKQAELVMMRLSIPELCVE